MRPMRDRTSSGRRSSLSDSRARALAYAALGVLCMLPFWQHPFACPFGLHDWAYPCLRSQAGSYLPSLVAPWWDTNLGVPHALPQITPPWMLLGLLVAVSPAIGLRVFLLAAFVAAALAADVAAVRLFGARDRWARLVAGVIYASSPFLATKLASGHLGFIACAPLLPAALIALDACAGADRKRAWAVCALCAASAFAQLQCGLVLLALMPVMAWKRVAARVWLAVWAVAAIAFLPVAFATVVAYRGGVFAPETQLAAWLADKSVAWQHAIDGTAYFARYFQTAVPNPAIAAWQIIAPASFVVALWHAGAPRRLAVAALLLAAFATGTTGPLSTAMGALFAHIPAASIFREFYDVLFVAPLVVAGGAAIAVDALAAWRPVADAGRPIVAVATASVVALLVSPAAFGELASLVPFVDVRTPRLPEGDDRVMWLPITPPVGPRNAPGGADPYQVPVEGHPAATAFHPVGVLAYAGALADRGLPLSPDLLRRLDISDVVDRAGIVSHRLSSAAHAQGGEVTRSAAAPVAPDRASVLAMADGPTACEPDLRAALQANRAAYVRCDVVWSVIPREDATTSEDDPATGWIEGERWALLDAALATPRWPVLFTRSKAPYPWQQPRRGVTWIYAPHGAMLDTTTLAPRAAWEAVPTGAGPHALRGDGAGIVAISATLPAAQTSFAQGPIEVDIPASMSDRYAGSFDARLEPHGPATIVLREGWSDGWRASIDGRDLGKPFIVDGYAAGWIVDAARSTSMLSIRYAPATPYFALLALSWLTLAALIAIESVVVFRRREP